MCCPRCANMFAVLIHLAPTLLQSTQCSTEIHLTTWRTLTWRTHTHRGGTSSAHPHTRSLRSAEKKYTWKVVPVARSHLVGWGEDEEKQGRTIRTVWGASAGGEWGNMRRRGRGSRSSWQRLAHATTGRQKSTMDVTVTWPWHVPRSFYASLASTPAACACQVCYASYACAGIPSPLPLPLLFRHNASHLVPVQHFGGRRRRLFDIRLAYVNWIFSLMNVNLVRGVEKREVCGYVCVWDAVVPALAKAARLQLCKGERVRRRDEGRWRRQGKRERELQSKRKGAEKRTRERGGGKM